MIPIDQLTLILTAILVLSALITPLLNPFFRRLKRQSPSAHTSHPGITVLLVSNGDSTSLDEHLPIYLTQDYGGDFQVIVVAEKADMETGNVLRRYAQDPRLYSTFVPESSRYMSKNKLAITLGVKASRNEWIILSDPRLKPTGNKWLEAMSAYLGDHENMVLGYSNYSDDAPAFHRFEHLHSALYILHDAQTGQAFRTNCQHLAFRKSEFMAGNGFVEYLKYSIGEYEFLVNKYAREGNTVVATDPQTWLVENPLPEKTWENRQVYYQEVRRHLERGVSLRLLYNTDQLLLHLNYLLILGTGLFAGFTGRWILLGASVVALLVTVCLRTLFGRRALSEFQTDIPSYKIVPMEIGILWKHVKTRLHYEYADKKDFISHKV